MSDSVMVALVAGISNILAIVVGRLLSRSEHKKTAMEVREIKNIVQNGKY